MWARLNLPNYKSVCVGVNEKACGFTKTKQEAGCDAGCLEFGRTCRFLDGHRGRYGMTMVLDCTNLIARKKGPTLASEAFEFTDGPTADRRQSADEASAAPCLVHAFHAAAAVAAAAHGSFLLLRNLRYQGFGG